MYAWERCNPILIIFLNLLFIIFLSYYNKDLSSNLAFLFQLSIIHVVLHERDRILIK
jgi:hypothetical protein